MNLEKIKALANELAQLHNEGRQALLSVLRARYEQMRPKPKVVKTLNLIRRTGPEMISRPQYAKWATMLIAGTAVRLKTSHDRTICFIPGAVFMESDDTVEKGMLMVTYDGYLFKGVVELDFSKSPNPFYLKSKGFPISIGTLICKTIYSMFPHLNPLTAEDIDALRASQKRSGATSTLKLAAPKINIRKGQQDKPAEVNTSSQETSQTKPKQTKPKTSHDRKTKQQKVSSETLPGGEQVGSTSKGNELPNQSRGRVRDRRKGKRGSEAAQPIVGESASVVSPSR